MRLSAGAVIFRDTRTSIWPPAGSSAVVVCAPMTRIHSGTSTWTSNAVASPTLVKVAAAVLVRLRSHRTARSSASTWARCSSRSATSAVRSAASADRFASAADVSAASVDRRL